MGTQATDDRGTFHPDLARARFIPRITFGPRTGKLLQRLDRGGGRIPRVEDVAIEQITIPGQNNASGVPLRIYRPHRLVEPAPALLWFHGGGYVMGNEAQAEADQIQLARELGITVVSVRYRLAPDHPSPAAVEDAYAAFLWLNSVAHSRGIDSSRIAVGGASAGGGLAASLALYANDRGTLRPVFQLLVYPMLDDRTVLRTDLDTEHVRMWEPASNLYAWSSYLGHAPGLADASEYAAPARRSDLSGLPPAWIGVGTLDLFYDEDRTYAERLTAAGVPCELVVVPGAFHAFDMFAKAPVVKEFKAERTRALAHGLGIPLNTVGGQKS